MQVASGIRVRFFDGQHPAIIDPGTWDKVQELLSAGAARTRGDKQKATRSPLAGKLFDETGDRLTPSHSRKNGKRLRYYISRRLVTDRSGKHPDAWRLSAEQLEGLLSETVLQHLGRSGAAAVMTTGLQASDLPAIEAALRETLAPHKAIALIERADLRPGALRIGLDAQLLAGALNIAPDNLNSAELSIEAPFQMRRRGVEQKLHLGVAPREIDPVLVRNILKARTWLEMIIEGKTFADIAETEGTSKRRIQAVVELALLSPDLLEAIATGEQPAGLTSDYLIKTSFSAIWSEQREQFADL